MKLVKYTETDEPLYSQLVCNEQTMRMNLGRAFTKEEAKLLFQRMLYANASESRLGFYKVLISQEDNDIYIGMGAISNEESDSVEIEYMLLPEYWNHGYGTELVGRLLQMVAEAKRFSKVIAITDPENLYSRRILCKSGFKLEKRYLNDDKELVELYSKPLLEK